MRKLTCIYHYSSTCMSSPEKAGTSEASEFIAQGALLKHWRNEVKVPVAYVSRVTGISENDVKAMERGDMQPSLEQLQKFADVYVVSLRDLLPAENDLEQGIKILRHADALVTPQDRAGRLQYTYWSRVMTKTIPNFKPVELELHLHDRDSVTLNRGHFFHQYTQVLDGGPVATLWKEGEETHEEVFEKGDSFLIPGFVPHGFYSPDKEKNGRILAITFGQHLASGDARAEMGLIGQENLPRIVSDEDYFKQ